MDFLKFGDHNSSWFHRKNHIEVLKDARGTLCSKPEELEDIVMTHFDKLFSSSNPSNWVRKANIRRAVNHIEVLKDARGTLCSKPEELEDIVMTHFDKLFSSSNPSNWATFLPVDAAIIKNIPLCNTWPPDPFSWHFSPSGELTVRSAHDFIQHIKMKAPRVEGSSEAAASSWKPPAACLMKINFDDTQLDQFYKSSICTRAAVKSEIYHGPSSSSAQSIVTASQKLDKHTLLTEEVAAIQILCGTHSQMPRSQVHTSPSMTSIKGDVTNQLEKEINGGHRDEENCANDNQQRLRRDSRELSVFPLKQRSINQAGYVEEIHELSKEAQNMIETQHLMLRIEIFKIR
ncbi:hypothetical protein Cgig2_002272 [Carnegiea gigantea]|uniref:Uncharacterized protein n=1 Tax=Carnegiea gigantea TaxID=171969 RepID=A0A9Q1QRB8_9CARY|nr:hypothetical protein Cgig2_002272 [Carnegiea gigantea]